MERDDGVAYRIYGWPITAELPHDLVHFTVERALGMGDGIWGAIAAGVVFSSMRHCGGRRPPHAAERSAALVRINRDRIQRAEVIGGFIEQVAALANPTPADVARLARQSLSTRSDGDLDFEQTTVAADALREMAARWAALSVGGELTLDWPAHLRLPAPALSGPAGRRRDRTGARRGRMAARRAT